MHDHSQLYETTTKLLTPQKGILAADQSSGTMNKILAGIGVAPEAEMRRQYRQLLFTTEGIEQYTSGVILYDSSIRNQTDDGTPFVDVLTAKGIVPIIKVDKGTKPHLVFGDEVVTQGLDDLDDRLHEYYELGARAAKWRAVFAVTDTIPSEHAIVFDCMQLVRYVQLCHEAGIVPIVEPEVLYSGSHSVERAEVVTTTVLRKLFELLQWYRVDLQAVILKSSMVLAGSEATEPTAPSVVAEATLRTFNASVPHEVPGIVFLSGGQAPAQATTNFDAIAEAESAQGGLPWELAFSFSRGIETPAQEAWRGQPENVAVAQAALLERLRLNSLADAGDYEPSLES